MRALLRLAALVVVSTGQSLNLMWDVPLSPLTGNPSVPRQAQCRNTLPSTRQVEAATFICYPTSFASWACQGD